MVELQQKNAELQMQVDTMLKRPYEAVFALAGSKSVDGTAQLVGMHLFDV